MVIITISQGLIWYTEQFWCTYHMILAMQGRYAFISGSEQQLHIGFIMSRKLFLNLCLLRWLKFSLKRMSNLFSLLSGTAKTLISEVLVKLRNAFLNDNGEGNDFMSSIKLFHPWEQRGKNVLLKLNVPEAVCSTMFFDLVW